MHIRATAPGVRCPYEGLPDEIERGRRQASSIPSTVSVPIEGALLEKIAGRMP